MTVAGSVPAEQLLETSESWFKTLVEATSTGIFVFRDRLLYVNPACSELTGFTEEQLLTLELPDLLPERHRLVAERALDRQLAAGDGATRVHEIPIVRQDGQRRHLQIRTVPVELAGSMALVGTATDVTERREAEEALRESEHWFRTLAETTTTAIFVYESDRFVYVNRAAEELTGYSSRELVDMAPTELAHPDHAQEVRKRVAQRLGGEDVQNPRIEVRIVTKSGTARWIEVSAASLEMGDRPAVLGTAIDVTQRKQAELALKESERQAQVTLASIGDGVIRTDAEGRIDYLNPVAERLTGWSSEAAVGEPLNRVFHIVDELTRKPLENPVALCFRKRHVIELPNPALLLRQDGQEFAVRDTVAPILDPDGEPAGAVLVFKDVTELRGMEREMAYLAHHDPLTGLLNRREFGRVVEASLETVKPGEHTHALLHFDLDGFKLINDTLGPVAGDEVLRRVADLLATHLTEHDAMARVGSDEFALLLTDVSAEEARDRAESLRDGIESLRFPWQERVVQLTTSIGLMLLDDAESGQAEVLKAADAACYVAKEQGRNRIHEYRPDDRAVAERSGEMQWIHRIHEAFEHDRFSLFRQRIVPLFPNDDRAEMFEIFIRMRDVGGSWIAPGAFIPAAEKYRLAPRIDRWVVHHALDLLDAEDSNGAAHTINLSGQSLGEESFLDDVVQTLESSGVSPRRVCFEITETAAIAHLSRAIRFISVLRGLGCRFILDDFGSGLSSFAYLKNLTVDFLKIDREFVSEMRLSRIQKALVKSIHQIGHDMGIETIAEGIETQETYETLKELGVDYGQGYWIERPKPFGST